MYLLFSIIGDNWREARKLNVSTQHILVPMHFNVELSKAMVFMDIRMPKYVFSVSYDYKFFKEIPNFIDYFFVVKYM